MSKPSQAKPSQNSVFSVKGVVTMESFVNDLGSPSWWLGVVVVGLLINVVSSYLRSFIDRALESISSFWRARSEKEKSRYEKELRGLLVSSERRRLLEFNALKHRILFNTCMIFAVMNAVGLILVARFSEVLYLIMMVLAVSFMIAAIRHLWRASANEMLFLEVVDLLDK